MKVYLGPSSASTAIWWCHTVRTQVGLLEPLPSQTARPKHTKLMEGVDHRITHLLRSFQLQLRGCGWGGLDSSSPGSRGRRGGSASRHPRCPPWPPDGCARLGTRAQPLGSCWKLQENRRKIPCRYAIEDRKAWTKETETLLKQFPPEGSSLELFGCLIPALHGFCSFSGLGRIAKQIVVQVQDFQHLELSTEKCYGK